MGFFKLEKVTIPLSTYFLISTFFSALGGSGDELANLGKHLVTDSEHGLSTCVYDDVFNRVVEADRACDAKWLSLKTPEDLAAYQRQVREKAIEALGGLPQRTSLNGRVTGTIPFDGYRIEKVLFESRPRFYVTGHLYVPEDARFKSPYPAVSVPCGHSFDGKAAPWYSNVGVIGAQRGFVVLVYDPVEQGERYQKRDGRNSWRATGEHDNIGIRALLLGESMALVRLFDGMRAIDYLASRTDVVDPKRIGVAGISGGGTLSAYINAFEQKVSCGSPSGFLSTIRDVYDNCGPQDAEQVIFGQLSFGLNHLGLVCLRAPSPVLVSASHADFFPFMGTTDLVDKARKVYAVAGATDRIDLLSVSGPHHWYGSQKDVQFGWMAKWLMDRDDAYESDHRGVRRKYFGYDYKGVRGGISGADPKVKNVTPTGRVLDMPGARSIYDIYRDKLAAIKGMRVPVTADAVRRMSGIRTVAELVAEEVPVEGGIILSRNDDFTPIPVFIARPTRPSEKSPVLVVSDVTSRKELVDVLRGYLLEGISVAVADVRGFGETCRSRHPYNKAKTGDEEIALCLAALGDSIVARRAEDVAIAARYAKRVFGAPVLLRAEGRAVVPAVHAHFLEPHLFADIEIVRAPASWERTVADETIEFPVSCVVRGALSGYDWTDLVATGRNPR